MRSSTLFALTAVFLLACSKTTPPGPEVGESAKQEEQAITSEGNASEPIEVLAVFAQPQVSELSCDAIRDITKTLIGEGKPIGEELLLGLGACDKRMEANDATGTVVAVKQEDGKYFYDVIPKHTAEKAADVCRIGAAAGAALIAAGEENLTVTLYGAGGRACDELLEMAARDNPLLLIDPVGAIAMNETRRVGKKVLRGMKLYDNYQEATGDLEDAAQRLHRSANKDIVQVKEWVEEDPTRAAVYASNPMIGPIYENRIKIGKEVGKAGQCVIDVIRGKGC